MCRTTAFWWKPMRRSSPPFPNEAGRTNRLLCAIPPNISPNCGTKHWNRLRHTRRKTFTGCLKKYPICGPSDPVPTIRKTMKAIHPYVCPRCCRLPANTFRTGMANSASKFCIAKGGRREVKKTKAAADMPCAICRTAGLSRSGNISVHNIDTARYTANIVGSFRFCV